MEASSVRLRDPEFVKDPFPILDLLRDKLPVFRSDEFNAVVVSRYDDVVAVLKDAETFSSQWIHKVRAIFSPQESVRKVLADGYPDDLALIWADGADHSYHADIVRPFLTAAALKLMEPTVREICQEVVDQLEPGVEVNLVEQFTTPIAINTMCAFVGVGREKVDIVVEGADAEIALQGAFTTEEQCVEYARQYVAFQHLLADELEDRKANPKDDLLTAIANPPDRDDGGKVLDKHLQISLVKLAVIAGNETTRGLISQCLLNIANDPSVLDRISNDRAALESFIEETLRVSPPVMISYRIATRDTEIAGFPVKEGEVVIVSTGAANHDPSKFTCPHDHNIDRENVRRHLSFGFGAHYCIGFGLARMETRLALETFLERFDPPILSKTHDPERYPSFLVYNLHNLPATLRVKSGV
jgi:cytochrome P450